MEAFIYLKVKASLGHYILLHIVEHNSSGPARGFGYTVSRAILIQVYGIFWSKFGYKVFSFSWILGIRYMVQKSHV